ncbi:C-signal-like [Ruditapes philippinarum]|uniref:C-signal-like n=1 Tax=Ruditapes philippinarum TaxID=129788 RepID=UPI00295A7FDD|nr:C-signal-like [Ruditapes philippinarum]
MLITKMLSPKSVLITGCNRGIGLEFVKQFLQLTKPPRFLFACCRNPEQATDLNVIAKSNSSVTVLQIDVTKQESIDKAKAYVASKVEGDGLNLLINNSGLVGRQGVEDVTREDMLKCYEVNAIGPLMMAQAFLPLLRQAASLSPSEPLSCNKAAIINMSTGVASISENSSGGRYPYRASKAALNMITSNLSLDLKTDGILCTAIHPGWVKTEMGGPNALISTEESLKGIMSVLEKLQGEEGSGKFYHGVRGDLIGW